MKPPLPNLTREDLQAALFGFGVARQELSMREERFRELLETMNGTNGLVRKKSHHKRLIQASVEEAGAETVVEPLRAHSESLQQEYYADGQAKYRTDSDGNVKVSKITGLPYRNPRHTPEMKQQMQKQAAFARAALARKRAQGVEHVPKGVKMEYWPDGSEKFLRNTDGSVRLTRLGLPWKRLQTAVARQSADKSHQARGVGQYKTAGG